MELRDWNTESVADHLVERWHEGEGEGLKLYEFMRMSREEYKTWMEKNELPIDLVQRHV